MKEETTLIETIINNDFSWVLLAIVIPALVVLLTTDRKKAEPTTND